MTKLAIYLITWIYSYATIAFAIPDVSITHFCTFLHTHLPIYTLWIRENLIIFSLHFFFPPHQHHSCVSLLPSPITSTIHFFVGVLCKKQCNWERDRVPARENLALQWTWKKTHREIAFKIGESICNWSRLCEIENDFEVSFLLSLSHSFSPNQQRFRHRLHHTNLVVAQKSA